MIWVFIKDKDEKSLSSRKEAPQEPLLLEMFEHREQNSSEVLAAQTFISAVIADWFFALCAVWSCLFDFHLNSLFLKEFIHVLCVLCT